MLAFHSTLIAQIKLIISIFSKDRINRFFLQKVSKYCPSDNKLVQSTQILTLNVVIILDLSKNK